VFDDKSTNELKIGKTTKKVSRQTQTRIMKLDFIFHCLLLLWNPWVIIVSLACWRCSFTTVYYTILRNNT
jgi:hypothetical protein